ncbi:MAG: anaerobic sulfatase maturase [Verrucomicrobia bacterium]|nr:anaerobic sulfatase maturase [Verrucomicrobiota bacterium]
MSAVASNAARVPAFHIMAKPMGPVCNLDCKYCFYLEKEKLYPANEHFRMSDAVLEQFVRQYIAAQDGPEVTFAWQGGEPTLMGVEFFRKAVALQKQFADGKKISNTLQTNATLLDDEWCTFLAENQFLTGVSVDGPRELHDAYRVDKQQRPTFDAVMRGVELLKKHKAEFNTLTVVNRLNSQQPLKVYHFLKELGSRYLQFIPLVERPPDETAKSLGLDRAGPPELKRGRRREATDDQCTRGTPHPTLAPSEGERVPEGRERGSPVTEWSVDSKQFGEFLVQIFEEWVVRDVGRTFVQLFDVTLSNWMGLGSAMCIFSERCGRALALEHDGGVFSCDHYVYPHFKLGNLMNASLGDLVNSPAQQKFGNDKADTLPKYCRECEVRFACHGECPKHRFITTPDGEPGLNYLCAGYKRFFNHVEPYMIAMAQLIQAGRPPSAIMDLIAEHERSDVWANIGRNDPCPCGSGKKYKQCCLERRTAHNPATAQP